MGFVRLQYDKGGKWLIEHHADAILKLAGVGPVTSWTPLPGELVQSRQLPDGLIEARIVGQADPVLFLIEINTYPYSRIAAELLDDVVLTTRSSLESGESLGVECSELSSANRPWAGSVAAADEV